MENTSNNEIADEEDDLHRTPVATGHVGRVLYPVYLQMFDIHQQNSASANLIPLPSTPSLAN